MGSKQRQTKERQQQEFIEQLTARKALLLEKGLKQENLENDKVIQHLRAQLKRTRRAIASINTTLGLREKAKAEKLERERKIATEGLESKKRKKTSAGAEKTKKKKKQIVLPADDNATEE
jgi:hypothetical protein